MFKNKKSTKRLDCNEGCKRAMNVADLKIETEDIPEHKAERYFFRCPLCNWRYTAYFKQNGKIKKKIKGVV